MEAIKFEKDIEAISNNLRNEESEGSIIEKNGKNKKQPSKIESNKKDRVILQLNNEIMNLKRTKGEGINLSRRKLVQTLPLRSLQL